jgi:GTP-binding protein
VNKWDLIEKDTFSTQRFEQEYRLRMKFLDYAPMAFISAKTGQRVSRTLELARDAYQGGKVKVPTGELNAFLSEHKTALYINPGGQRKPRLKFACQVGVLPPTFVLFLRGAKELHFSTARFIRNRLRERYGFFGSPIRLIQRPARQWSERG